MVSGFDAGIRAKRFKAVSPALPLKISISPERRARTAIVYLRSKGAGRPTKRPGLQDCFPFVQESPRDAQASVRPRLWCDVRRAVAAHGLCRPFRNYLLPRQRKPAPRASLAACLSASSLMPASVPATSSKRGRGGDLRSGVSPLVRRDIPSQRL